eukprot:scaffold93009_cov60-Phaeocystis_antarctica.AAC.3
MPPGSAVRLLSPVYSASTVASVSSATPRVDASTVGRSGEGGAGGWLGGCGRRSCRVRSGSSAPQVLVHLPPALGVRLQLLPLEQLDGKPHRRGAVLDARDEGGAGALTQASEQEERAGADVQAAPAPRDAADGLSICGAAHGVGRHRGVVADGVVHVLVVHATAPPRHLLQAHAQAVTPSPTRSRAARPVGGFPQRRLLAQGGARAGRVDVRLCAKVAAAQHVTAEPQSTGDDAFLGLLAWRCSPLSLEP